MQADHSCWFLNALVANVMLGELICYALFCSPNPNQSNVHDVPTILHEIKYQAPRTSKVNQTFLFLISLIPLVQYDCGACREHLSVFLSVIKMHQQNDHSIFLHLDLDEKTHAVQDVLIHALK